MKAAIQALNRKVGHQSIVEQAAIAGALAVGLTVDASKAKEAAEYIAKRLDKLLPENERGWKGDATKQGGMTAFLPARWPQRDPAASPWIPIRCAPAPKREVA